MIASPNAYQALQRFKESLRVGAAFSANLSNADGVYFVFAMFIANFARLYSGENLVNQGESDLRSCLNSRFSIELPTQKYTAASHFKKFVLRFSDLQNSRITQLNAV